MIYKTIRFNDIMAHYSGGAKMGAVQRLTPRSVLYVNEAVLERDFPVLNGPEKCRNFVAHVGSVLSAPNFASPEVTSPPTPVDGTVACLRPPRYGRAGIVDATEILTYNDLGDQALVDVKGIGVAPGVTPLPAKRSTGLMTVMEAVQELINQTFLNSIFEREGVDVVCTEIYGIAFAGVMGYSTYFRDFVPCVTLLRRVHLRNADNNELPLFGSNEEAVKIEIERLLRRYGVTSAPAQCALKVWEEDGALKATHDGYDLTDRIPEKLLRYHFEVVGLPIPQTIRFINIQTAGPIIVSPLSARLIDFGHYTVLPNFGDHHLVSGVSDRPLNWGRLYRNDAADWVEPDPICALNTEALGKARFSDYVVDRLPLSPLMQESQRNGMIPGSMRYAADLTAAWLDGSVQAEEIGPAAITFALNALPDGDTGITS